jgi:predicted porin
MKKLVLAAALASAFAGSAFAQSSVTLYGRINTTIEFQDNETIDKTVMRNTASRWGLRGNEDLGGGLSAFFQLESGFGSDDGSGTGGFNRDAFVGLKSNTLGQLKFGKIFLGPLYASTIDYIGVFNHDTGTTSEDNVYTLPIGFNNAVEYTSPTFGGFSFILFANASEAGLASFGNYLSAAKTYEGVINYDIDGLHLAGGYSKSEDVLGNDAIEGFSLAAAYTLGPVLLGLAYENTDVTGLGKRDQVTGTAMYTLGASEFHLSVGWAGEWDNVADSDALQYTVGYNYNLSKRTKVYAFYHAMDNKSGTAGAIVYGGTANVPAIAGQTFSSIGLGIRHNF